MRGQDVGRRPFRVRAVGTGSGMASPLNPMHRLAPIEPRPCTAFDTANATATTSRTRPFIPGPPQPFALTLSPRQLPFLLGGERQLRAFVKGPHMTGHVPRPETSAGGLGLLRSPPCFAAPGRGIQSLMARESRRGGFKLSGIPGSPRTGTSSLPLSPRADICHPQEGGAGVMVNGTSRQPTAFAGRHSAPIGGNGAMGSTPYPGCWFWS